MIVEAIVSLFVGLVDLLAALLGDLPAPGWLLSVGGDWSELVGRMVGLGAWIPWSVLRAVVVSVLACVGISFAIKAFRIGLSLFTGGGGSAA